MKKGFTTIEFLIVVAIVGFLAAILMPVFTSSYDNLKIEGAYKQLMQDIRYAQQLAISHQVTHGVSFDVNNEAYFVYRQNTSSIVKDPSTQKKLSVSFAAGKFQCINLVGTTFVFPSDVLEFNAIGAPSSGGAITLNYNGITKTVTIEANTGRVY